MQLEIDEFNDELPMDQIDLATTNVRITGKRKGLEDLKESIKRFGLFQPVTVFEKDGRYKLLVGQRRFVACKELGWETISAFIIRPLSSKIQTIVSFGENVHRRSLPYEDSIQACDKLYGQYTGGKNERVKKIAKDLGISIYLVHKYLTHKLIPPAVRKFVSEGKLSEDIADRITSAHFPNVKKIIEIATSACRMTSAEAQRVAEYSKKYPKASVREILDYAKNPPPIIELIIHIEPDIHEQIKETARRKKLSIESYVKDAIYRQLDDDE